LLKKIIIGTASFGNYYGVANNKKLNFLSCKKIFSYCKKKNIFFFDTAPNYKRSEEYIGKSNIRAIKVYTKIKDVDNINFSEVFKEIKKSILNSIKLTKVKELEGVYIHNSQFYKKKNHNLLWRSLQKLKNQKIIKRIGVSVYTVEDLCEILKLYTPDIVQAPISIFNRDFLNRKILKLKHKYKFKLYARSIFLQGLLLQSENILKKKFKIRFPFFYKYEKWVKQKKITKLEASLNFVLQNKNIDKIILGINSLNHLKQILNTRNKKVNFKSRLLLEDMHFKDPRIWKIK
jgi:aryl-alcohol dehydrogenase-like predicted oxidoreductase